MEDNKTVKKIDTVRKTLFEDKIKPILTYVGTIGAIAMAVAYIVLMFVMVLGFKAQSDLSQAITFSVVNAVVGFIIMQLLKVQGIDFAKQQHHKLLERYNKMRVALNPPKKKKFHTMTHFWVSTVIKDALIKGLAVIISTSCIIYIVVEGSQDYNMLLLSVVNLIMFACFGLLSLVKAYDFYNEDYVPYMEEELTHYEQKQREETEEEQREQSNQICRENMERPDCNVKEQGNMVGNTTSGSDILDSSVGTSVDSNNNTEPLVVDNSDSCNSVLGRSIYTSNSTSNSICDVSSQNSEQEKETKTIEEARENQF